MENTGGGVPRHDYLFPQSSIHYGMGGRQPKISLAHVKELRGHVHLV